MVFLRLPILAVNTSSDQARNALTYLGNPDTSSCNDHSRRRRDVIRIPPISTCTNNINGPCVSIAFFVRFSIVPFPFLRLSPRRSDILDLDGVFAQNAGAGGYYLGGGVES